MQAAAYTSLWVVVGASLMSPQQAVQAEQTEFRFPPNTPVTCAQPERGKIFSQLQSFYRAKERSRQNTSREARYSYMGTWNSWYEKCVTLCPKLKPISPGYGWIYAGQYGSTIGARGCYDKWIKLDRKDGDRVTFSPDSTSRIEGPNQKYDYSSEWNRSYTVRCSTKDFWDKDLGWAPIKPWTVIDEAARRFC